MIKLIRRRGLRRFYAHDDRRGLTAAYLEKIGTILAQLDIAMKPADMDLPGFRLHPLRGELAGFWAVTVRANWRIIFRFDGRDATDVNLIDYH